MDSVDRSGIDQYGWMYRDYAKLGRVTIYVVNQAHTYQAKAYMDDGSSIRVSDDDGVTGQLLPEVKYMNDLAQIWYKQFSECMTLQEFFDGVGP